MIKLTAKQKETVIKTSCFSKAPPSLIKVAVKKKPKGIKPIKFAIISCIKILLNLYVVHAGERIFFSNMCILDGILRWFFPPAWSIALSPTFSSKTYNTKGFSFLANEKFWTCTHLSKWNAASCALRVYP